MKLCSSYNHYTTASTKIPFEQFRKFAEHVFSKICANFCCFMITNQSYISQPFTKNGPLKNFFAILSFFHYSNITMFYVTKFLKKLPFASTNFQTSNKAKFKFKIKMPKMTKQYFQRPVFCKWLTYVSMICNYKAAISAYSGNNKSQISHISSVQLYLANKKDFLPNFGNYSKDPYFPANGYEKVKFCNIVEIRKKLKNGSFFHKIFVKSHFKIETMKIPKMKRQHFQWAVYRKANVFITEICHYFIAFRAYYTH